MSSQQTINVEIGEIVAMAGHGVLTVPHFSAGVVVVLYDIMGKLGAVAHIALPDSTVGPPGEAAKNEDQPGKFADLAIPTLLELYRHEGGQLANTLVRMVGGAQLFNFGGGSGNLLNVGARNASAVKTALSRHGIAIDKEEVGGNKARSLKLDLSTGQLFVGVVGGETLTL
ncbi:MAG: chemotaxis protein CheD [Vampirovibrionales bacterium]|nr:chemotaxis protein CheD [Vampirovibrionales bacterium]